MIPLNNERLEKKYSIQEMVYLGQQLEDRKQLRDYQKDAVFHLILEHSKPMKNEGTNN